MIHSTAPTEHWEVRRRRWRRLNVYPLVAAGIIASMSALIPMILALHSNPGDHRPMITQVGMYIAGIVGRRWMTLTVVVPTFALTLIAFDGFVMIFLGQERWNSLNSYEMFDSMRAFAEPLEHIVFGFLYAAFTICGILARMAVDALIKILATLNRRPTRS